MGQEGGSRPDFILCHKFYFFYFHFFYFLHCREQCVLGVHLLIVQLDGYLSQEFLKIGIGLLPILARFAPIQTFPVQGEDVGIDPRADPCTPPCTFGIFVDGGHSPSPSPLPSPPSPSVPDHHFFAVVVGGGWRRRKKMDSVFPLPPPRVWMSWSWASTLSSPPPLPLRSCRHCRHTCHHCHSSPHPPSPIFSSSSPSSHPPLSSSFSFPFYFPITLPLWQCRTPPNVPSHQNGGACHHNS